MSTDHPTIHRDTDGDGLAIEHDSSGVSARMVLSWQPGTREPTLTFSPDVARAIAADLLRAADSAEAEKAHTDDPPARCHSTKGPARCQWTAEHEGDHEAPVLTAMGLETWAWPRESDS